MVTLIVCAFQMNYNAELAQKNHDIQQKDHQLEEAQEQIAQFQVQLVTSTVLVGQFTPWNINRMKLLDWKNHSSRKMEQSKRKKLNCSKCRINSNNNYRFI